MQNRGLDRRVSKAKFLNAEEDQRRTRYERRNVAPPAPVMPGMVRRSFLDLAQIERRKIPGVD